METNILGYEEDLDKVKFLYAFLKVAQNMTYEEKSQTESCSSNSILNRMQKVL